MGQELIDYSIKTEISTFTNILLQISSTTLLRSLRNNRLQYKY